MCRRQSDPPGFDEAIDQLLGYTLWRDSKAAIVLFITQRNATCVIDTAGGRLTGTPSAARPRCRQTGFVGGTTSSHRPRKISGTSRWRCYRLWCTRPAEATAVRRRLKNAVGTGTPEMPS
jgi:hypothetical protein